MRKSLSILLLLCVICVFSASGVLAAVSELSFTTPYMDKHPVVVNGLMPWIEEMSKASGGQLKITFFNPDTLTPTAQIAASLSSGAIDLGAHSALATAGTFPRTSCLGLQLVLPGGARGGALATKVYNEMPDVQGEFSRFKLLTFWAGGAENIHTTKKPVRKLEDLKGLKLIVWSPAGMETAKALGAIPVQQSAPDTYMALQRGMADGVICPVAPMRSFKLDEVIKYSTIAELYAAPFFMGISHDAWKRLPANLQQLIENSKGSLGQQCGAALDNGEAVDLEYMKKNGLEVIRLDDAERARWSASFKNLHEKWISDNEKRGLKTARQDYDKIMGIVKDFKAQK